MNRRILAIDPDAGFQRLLRNQLEPYGFEIAIAADGLDALTRVPQLQPVLLIISVEEPDKHGFSLFNKAKKGVASSIPIVLATSTVSADSFANHRRLKLHADEYIDKRSLSPAELLGKVDNLIGLGELSKEFPKPTIEKSAPIAAPEVSAAPTVEGLPVEVDDIPMELSDGDLVLEETFGEDEPVLHHTTPPPMKMVTIPPPFTVAAGGGAAEPVDDRLSAETDAAFDALLGDAPAAPAAPARARAASEPPRPRPKSQSAIPELIPAPTPPGLPRLSEPEASAFPTADGIPQLQEPVMGHVVPIAPPAAEPLAAAVAAPEPAAPVAVMPANAAKSRPSVLDLGLDEVAKRANEEQSGVTDRRTLQKIHNLEREVQRLKGELSRAHESSAKPTGAASREFLNLREMISSRDREILELRETNAEYERVLGEARERLRQAQHAKGLVESKNLELEQRIVTDAERVDSAEAGKRTAEAQVRELQARIVDVEQTARVEIERYQEKLSRAEKATADAEANTVHERGVLEQERTKALDALRTELEKAREIELAAQRVEHEEDLARQAGELEAKHANDMHATSEELAVARNRIKKLEEEAKDASEHQFLALAEAADKHARELAALRAELAKATEDAAAKTQEEVDKVRRAHVGELEQLAVDHGTELQAARDEAKRQVADTEARLTAALDAARKEAADTEVKLRADLDVTSRTLVETRRELETRHAAAINELTTTQETALADLKRAHGAEIDRLNQDHTRDLDAEQERHTAAMEELRGHHRNALLEKDQAAAKVEEEHRRALANAGAVHAEAMAKLRLEQARALEQAEQRLVHQKEADRADADRALAAARAEHETKLAEAHDEAAQLQKGLSGAREQIRRLEQEIANRDNLIKARDGEISKYGATIEERDRRIADLRSEIEALETENATYQEQVLKAYQKIKADEATVSRAKKALAIALTALHEDEKKPE